MIASATAAAWARSTTNFFSVRGSSTSSHTSGTMNTVYCLVANNSPSANGSASLPAQRAEHRQREREHQQRLGPRMLDDEEHRRHEQEQDRRQTRLPPRPRRPHQPRRCHNPDHVREADVAAKRVSRQDHQQAEGKVRKPVVEPVVRADDTGAVERRSGRIEARVAKRIRILAVEQALRAHLLKYQHVNRRARRVSQEGQRERDRERDQRDREQRQPEPLQVERLQDAERCDDRAAPADQRVALVLHQDQRGFEHDAEPPAPQFRSTRAAIRTAFMRGRAMATMQTTVVRASMRRATGL